MWLGESEWVALLAGALACAEERRPNYERVGCRSHELGLGPDAEPCCDGRSNGSSVELDQLRPRRAINLAEARVYGAEHADMREQLSAFAEIFQIWANQELHKKKLVPIYLKLEASIWSR